MKPSKTSKQWMREHVNDAFVQMAKKDGYRSRAAYKLLEIDGKDHLLKHGTIVVDLGATPGGWSQVAATKVGAAGKVVALDLLPLDPLPGVTFIQGDFREESVLKQLECALNGKAVGLVISDMAPNMTGVATVDQSRVMNVAELALDFADKALKPGGSLLIKTFQGAGFNEFHTRMRRRFEKLVSRKPSASRTESKEIYLLGRAFRQA